MFKILCFLCIFPISLNSQTPSGFDLIGKMKEKVIKAESYNNIYFDLNNRSIIQLAEYWEEKTYEDFVGFKDSVIAGSFTKPYSKQYILFLKWNYPESFSFPHVVNYGPLFQYIIFDSNYHQISNVFFHDATTELEDIIDIDKDGLNEILLTGMYCNQGVCMSWINIFYKEIKEPVLSYFSDMSVLSVPRGEFDEGYSSYSINDGKFIIDITRLSKLYLSEYDSRVIKEENCQRIYKYQKGIFTLESGKNCELEGY